MMNTGFEVSPKEEMVAMLTEEINGLRRRLSEIKDQVSAMQSSVDREQGRYANIAAELRTIKENLDTVPREDIRDKYDEALEVRFRLATMRSQVEKFESDRDTLTTQQELLQKVLSKLQGFDVILGEEDEISDGSGEFDVIGIIQAQEDERQRLARAMHDGPAQSLTNFILQAEICQRLFDRNPERAGEELGNLKTNASSTFQKVREFIFDLRPMMLDDLGVMPTVRRYVENYRDKNDIEVNLDILGEERRLEDYREVTIFRGVQDVMGAIRDYAAANRIDIKMDIGMDTVKISIEDDGRGFDAENIFENTGEEGYEDARVQALRMIRSKFELVGGTISVRSVENESTIVRMELPVGD